MARSLFATGKRFAGALARRLAGSGSSSAASTVTTTPTVKPLGARIITYASLGMISGVIAYFTGADLTDILSTVLQLLTGSGGMGTP